MKTMTDKTPTTAERLAALHPTKRAIMDDFPYEHLAREDMKQVSKILHDAMLELCETLPCVDGLKEVANKIWEGKNLAVNLQRKT